MTTPTVRLRYVAEVNPNTPEFDRLAADDPVTFLPLEAVWPAALLDTSRVRPKADITGGYTRFREGDILVPKITPTFQANRSVIAARLVDGLGAGTTELHVVRPGPRVDPRYLLYTLSSQPFLMDGEGSMIGVAGQKRVPDAFLRDYPVLLPHLREQGAIADYLDAETTHIDRVVAARQQQVRLLGQRRTGLVAAMVSGGPDAVAKPEVPWLQAVPYEWPVVSLGLVADIFNGSTPSRDLESGGGEIAWVTSGDIDQVLITVPTSHLDEVSRRAHGLRVAPAGSVIVGLVGQGRTRGLAARLALPATLNQNVAAICPRDDRLDPSYLGLLLELAYDDLRNRGRGGNQPALNCEMLMAYKIPLAPRGEQIDLVLAAEAERARDQGISEPLERSITLWSERRKALVTASVTGQLDIPGVAA